MRKPLYFILLIPILLSSFTLTLAKESLYLKGMRPQSMGGTFIAICDDENALFYNPAALSSEDIILFYYYYKRQPSFPGSLGSGWSFPIEGNLREKADKLDKILKEEIGLLVPYPGVLTAAFFTPRVLIELTEVALRISKWSELTKEERRELYEFVKEYTLEYYSVSPLFYFVKLNFGFGFFTRTSWEVTFDPGIFLPTLRTSLIEDFIFPVAIAFKPKILSRLRFGLTWKYIGRVKASLNKLEDYLQVGSELLELSRERKSGLGILLSEPLNRYIGYGWGFDAGMLYELRIRRVYLGAIIRNLGGVTLRYYNGRRVYYPMTLSLGISYRERFRETPVLKNLILGIDLENITSRKPKFHFGGELKLKTKMLLLTPRFGWEEGGATFGFGLSIPFLKTGAFQVEFTSYKTFLPTPSGPEERRRALLQFQLSL
jgi:hypothetical protein